MTRYNTILKLTIVSLILGLAGQVMAQNYRNPQRKRGSNSRPTKIGRNHNHQTGNTRRRGSSNRQVTRSFVDNFRVDGNYPGDLVTLSRRPGEANVIRISLKTPGTTWFKGIAVTDNRDHVWTVERQDGNYLGQPVMQIPSNRLGESFQLVFWKAKAFGIHTQVHAQAFAKSDFLGQLTTVTWNEAGNAAVPDDPAEDNRPVSQIDKTIVLDGGDLSIRSSHRNPGYVRFEYSSTIDWWNMLQVRDVRGNPLTIEMEKGNPYGANFIEVPTSQLDGIVKLEFWRAKTFGVHTQMGTYEVDRRALDGRVVRVNWNAK